MFTRTKARHRFQPLLEWPFWKEFFRVARQEELLAGAAQLSFYFTFALYPALLALLSIVAEFEIGAVDEALFNLFATVLPEDVVPLVVGNIQHIVSRPGGTLVGVSLVISLGATLRAVRAVGRILNRAAEQPEDRPLWMQLAQQTLAMALTGGFVISVALWTGIVRGYLGGFDHAWAGALWVVAKWIFLVVMFMGAASLLYALAPAGRQPWRWAAPGPLVAALAWSGGSIALRKAAAGLIDYHVFYGSVGTTILLLVWIYLTSICVLIGGHFEARARAHAKGNAIPPVALEEETQAPAETAPADDAAASKV